MVRRSLLACGVCSSLLYASMTVLVARQWPAYSSASQTISELSAVEAPTRSLWVPLGVLYTLLITLFGLGVWRSARRGAPLRFAGAAIMMHGLLGLAWPPMHQRAVLASGGATLTDTLHLAWAAMTVALMLTAITAAALALRWRFRLYSIGTVLVMATFGAWTAFEAPRVQADLPTPWLGIWERLSVGADMLWVAVLAVALLRRGAGTTRDVGAASLAA